jgi:hypothetical protein
MPRVFKAEPLSLCVNFAIEINNLCNLWVSKHNSRTLFKTALVRASWQVSLLVNKLSIMKLATIMADIPSNKAKTIS